MEIGQSFIRAFVDYRNPSETDGKRQVPKPTGYKATRKTIAQKRQEYREKVWRDADVPQSWEDGGASQELMQQMLSAENIIRIFVEG